MASPKLAPTQTPIWPGKCRARPDTPRHSQISFNGSEGSFSAPDRFRPDPPPHSVPASNYRPLLPLYPIWADDFGLQSHRLAWGAPKSVWGPYRSIPVPNQRYTSPFWVHSHHQLSCAVQSTSVPTFHRWRLCSTQTCLFGPETAQMRLWKAQEAWFRELRAPLRRLGHFIGSLQIDP